MPNVSSRNAVTSPVGPMVAMKAKASGTPAKFEATPLKVVSVGRRKRGTRPITTAWARKKPAMAPSSAEARLTLMLIQ